MDLKIKLEIIGFIGCTLIIISLLPQLIIIIINKSSKNISVLSYTILLIAQIFWTSYGILKPDFQIFITNIIGSILTFCILIISTYYKFYPKISIENTEI